MATVRLVPSTYSLSSTSLTISDVNNMYTNTDSTTYGTCSTTSSSTRYLYLRGFNLNSLPAGAEVTSFQIKIKASQSGLTTSTNYRPYLVNSTTTLTGTFSAITSSTATVLTCTGVSASWDTLASYGNNFGIRLTVRSASNNTTGTLNVYGAEVLVEYEIPNYYSVTATSAVNEVTVSPGSQSIHEGNDATITINTEDLSDYVVTDNDVDVTSNCVRHLVEASAQTSTFIPSSFDSTNSVYNTTAGDNGNGVYSTNYINNGLTDHTSSTRCALYTVQGSGSQSYMYYNFDCSSIPANVTINSVSCQLKAGTQGSSYYSSYVAQLSTGTTLKGNSTSVTGSNSSPSTVTINGGTNWTRNELNNIKIKFTVTRGSSNTTTDSTFSFFGATLTVNYTPIIEDSYYYTYTVSNIQEAHVILIDQAGVFIPPEEDPQLTYWPITISSINATTDPPTGTTRVVAGSNNTITIYPTDPQLTLALDNGVDITSQLQGGLPTNTYTVTTQVSGASYGFQLNSSTGYYVSTNNGVAKSASVARLNMDFESSCLVTIQYINYAEANYDYGMFGKLDTSVATDGLTASSSTGTSSPSDSTSNYQLAMASNSSSAQTISYNVPSGQHYIDIKYGKDDATNSNNDTLQWKVLSVEATGGGGAYTYTLNNVQEKHSLIFVFGNVSYYYITSSGASGMKLFPDGQSVALSGDSYKVIAIPANVSDSVSLYDNNIDVTSSLEREDGYDKNNNPAVSYTYRLSNISATHNLVFASAAGATDKFYIKQTNAWIDVIKIYLKQNNTWIQVPLSYLSDNNIEYLIEGEYQAPTETWETLYDGNINYFVENNGDYPYCWIQDLGNVTIPVGSVWRITYNNVEYRCTATAVNNVVWANNNTVTFIGNPKWSGSTDDNSNVPFCFHDYYLQYNAWSGDINLPNQNVTVSMKIERLVSS